eukprot:1140256-Pyramimonas_sp.AAC.1
MCVSYSAGDCDLASWVVPTAPSTCRARDRPPAPLQDRIQSASQQPGSGSTRLAACMRILSPTELQIAAALRGADVFLLGPGEFRESNADARNPRAPPSFYVTVIVRSPKRSSPN